MELNGIPECVPANDFDRREEEAFPLMSCWISSDIEGQKFRVVQSRHLIRVIGTRNEKIAAALKSGLYVASLMEGAACRPKDDGFWHSSCEDEAKRVFERLKECPWL